MSSSQNRMDERREGKGIITDDSSPRLKSSAEYGHLSGNEITFLTDQLVLSPVPGELALDIMRGLATPAPLPLPPDTAEVTVSTILEAGKSALRRICVVDGGGGRQICCIHLSNLLSPMTTSSLSDLCVDGPFN